MKQHAPAPRGFALRLSGAAILALFVGLGCQSAVASITLFSDSFQSYPVQNPAPNPLTNGPANGQWFYVDPVGPLTANEHRIFDAALTTGSGLNSRCWITLTNNAKLTNAITITALPANTNRYTFRLSFVAAPETGTTTRSVTFGYAISSSAGSLTFVSGGNQDNSVTFSGLSGEGTVFGGVLGKSPDRRFQVVFEGTDLTTADKIFLEFTRITNNPGGAQYFALDDVLLTVDDPSSGPLVTAVRPVLTLEHITVGFSEPVDPATATNAANYTVSGGALSVQSVSQLDALSVELRTTTQTPATSYTLQVANVKDLFGTSLATTQLNFTTPNLVISPVRYDAGNTVSQPSGPPDPVSETAGFWTLTPNTNNGLAVAAISDDLGSGLHAWQVTDQNVLANTGGIDYRMPIDQPSDDLARANGWRLTLRSRQVDSFGSTSADQVVLYGDTGRNLRWGLFFGLNASGNLTVNVLGGATYTLTTDGVGATDYHTHVLAYDPVSATASYYFDGRLIVTNYPGQSPPGYNGVAFGSASSAATGQMNYNLVQFDVVGGTPPTVTQQPQSSTNGVGQKVTFTAGFTPFVAGYQWLSNNLIIPGATGSVYTTDFITLGYNGSQYKCRALHYLGNVETAPAILTVTADTNPPAIAAVKGSLLRDRIRLTYSEPVLELYATNLANYVWVQPGITNVSAKMIDIFTVELRTTPFLANSNYTVRVSNVRDTSNLVIPANTPATFLVPALGTLARYYAGNTTDSPAGPPDPTSPEGGAWSLRLDEDPNVTTNAVVDDFGTGYHAWQVRDASTLTGHFCQYSRSFDAALTEAANRYGWVMTIFSRISEDLGTPAALYAQYSDRVSKRYLLNFDLNANGDLVVGLWTTNTAVNLGYLDHVTTSGGIGLWNYHLHQVVYDPATGRASYYFDGELLKADWVPGNYADLSVPAGVWWGSAASAYLGAMNYNLVQFEAVEYPFVTLTSDGVNVTVQYRGVLETASQLANPGTWTAIATNLSGGTYSIPISAEPEKYFRARLLQ